MNSQKSKFKIKINRYFSKEFIIMRVKLSFLTYAMQSLRRYQFILLIISKLLKYIQFNFYDLSYVSQISYIKIITKKCIHTDMIS